MSADGVASRGVLDTALPPEQREIAALAGTPASATHLGAVDGLIDQGIDRARRMLKKR
ncbi:hypothetical protein [Mycobacterium palustre]|uniref:hypothetical protein n=1 Tax=Mycobacterium palustre TaxID=153971 RepID=UPI001302CA77|nr:hypothetical protein [Mycobacterium palustre]MCV7100480.1 hypothetical protein [Mycobacterium palustre]